MKKALLVIDMQNVSVRKNHASYFKYDCEKLIGVVNGVIDENSGNLVIYVKNVMKKNLITRFFYPFHAYPDTMEAELADELKIVSDYVIEKYSQDAFSNERLNQLLDANQIECVEVVGVDGGACLSATAIGAVKAGYEVIFRKEAIGTMFVGKMKKRLRKWEIFEA